MRPADVSQDNSLLVYNRLKTTLRKRKPKYTVGQHVRIAKEKTIFEKGLRVPFHRRNLRYQ